MTSIRLTRDLAREYGGLEKDVDPGDLLPREGGAQADAAPGRLG